MASDVVCFHSFSSTMPKSIEYINKIKAVRPDMPIVMGGTHPSVMCEDTLQYCDVVVRKRRRRNAAGATEGVGRTAGDLSKVLGISYWQDGKIKNNPDRPFVQGIRDHPRPRADPRLHELAEMEAVEEPEDALAAPANLPGLPLRLLILHRAQELGRGYRVRSIDSIIEDIKYQQNLVGSKYFFIVDNHFTVKRDRTKELLNRIIEEKIDWYGICFTRMEVARDQELLALLKKAQINTLYMGLESFDNDVLKKLNKAQTQEGLRKSLAAIKAHKLRVLGVVRNGVRPATPWRPFGER